MRSVCGTEVGFGQQGCGREPSCRAIPSITAAEFVAPVLSPENASGGVVPAIGGIVLLQSVRFRQISTLPLREAALFDTLGPRVIWRSPTAAREIWQVIGESHQLQVESGISLTSEL